MAIYHFNPQDPIPNNPFYYPQQETLSTGAGSPLIIGTGLEVDYATGTLSAIGGGGGGTVTVAPPLVNIGTPGAPIITALPATSGSTGVVQAGTNIQITAGGVISVRNAAVGISGVVALNDTVTSTSTTEALTANQGRALQEQINSLVVSGGLILAGTFDANAAQMTTVTGQGTAAGFTVGQNLPDPILSLSNYYVIVVESGTYTPPQGSTPFDLISGDWLLAEEGAWNYIGVGHIQPPDATTTTSGVVQLATAQEVFDGVNATKAVTPASLVGTYLPESILTNRGDIVVAQASGTPAILPPGVDGAILTACSAAPLGVTWTGAGVPTIPCACITAKGALLTGFAAGVVSALPVGTTGLVLTANSSCGLGMQWAPVPSTAIPCACLGARGDILAAGGANTPLALPVGTSGQILTPGLTTTGLQWVDNPAICCSTLYAKGALLTATAPFAPAAQPVGSNGQILVADSTQSTGLRWVNNDAISSSVLTGKGDLIAGDSLGNPTALTPGSEGQILVVSAASPTGLAWANNTGGTQNVQVTAPIVDTGTLGNPNIGIQTATTGQLGAVRVGTNIDVTAGVISVKSSSTTTAGIVKLNDTLLSFSNLEALTANQGRVLQDQINSITVSNNLTLAGTFNPSTRQMVYVSSDGAAAGFVVGANLPFPDPSYEGFFVILTEDATYQPPNGSAPIQVYQGNWLICNGVNWLQISTGKNPPPASATEAGIVELATDLETQAGTDTTRAVTPAGLAFTSVPLAEFSAKGDLLAATAAGTPVALPVGTEGQLLTASAAAAAGVCWADAPDPAIPLSSLAGKGSLVTATGAEVASTLPVGVNGYILSVNLACPSGLEWVANTGGSAANAIPCTVITGKGDILTGTGPTAPLALPVGTTGQILSADVTTATGLKWINPTAVQCAVLSGKGSLISATAVATPIDVPVGFNNQILVACNSTTSGLAWVNNPAVCCTAWSQKGTILSASAANTPEALAPSFTDGYVLTSCFDCTTGLVWAPPQENAIPCACIVSKGAIVTGLTAGAPVGFGPGSDGQVLTACSGCATGLVWALPAESGIPVGCISGKGGLITGTNASQPVALSSGTNGQILTVNTAAASGLEWIDNPSVLKTALAGRGSLITATSAATPVPLAMGTDQQVLRVNIACSTGLEWYTLPESICCACFQNAGDLLVGLGPSAATALPIGTPGQVLTATGLGGPGMVWCDASGGNALSPDIIGGKGWLITKDEVDIPVSLPPGVDGDLLVADSTCALGLKWSAYAGTCGYGDTPVGTVSWFAGPVAPAGWLIADGSIVSRTTYSALFAQIGTLYGVGDGASTFQLPDLRGQFIRGWDSAGGTSRGCDLGRTLGTTQPFALQNFTGTFKSFAEGSNKATGVFCCFSNWETDIADRTLGTWGCGSRVCLVLSDQVLTACETRPMNVAMIPCIKWQVTYAPVQPTAGIPCSCICSKGTLIAGIGPNSPEPLQPGANEEFLVADSNCALGLKWKTPTPTVPCAAFTAKGQILASTGASAITALTTPAICGQTLIANPNCPAGLEWCPGVYQCLTARGQLLTGGDGGPTRLDATGNNCRILQTCSACSQGMYWAVPDFLVKSGLNLKGEMYVGCGGSAPTTLCVPAGSAGCVLTTNPLCSAGMYWAPNTSILCTIVRSKGDLIAATGNAQPTALSVGSDGQFLTACSTAPEGIVWATYVPPAPVIAYCCGTIDSGSTYGNDCTYTRCGWLPGPGNTDNVPLGLWKVDIFGKYCTNAVANPDGKFYTSWIDSAGTVSCGPGLAFSPQQGGFIQFAYSSIASNQYCDCGICFNTEKTDSSNLECITIFYTAIYLGQG